MVLPLVGTHVYGELKRENCGVTSPPGRVSASGVQLYHPPARVVLPHMAVAWWL